MPKGIFTCEIGYDEHVEEGIEYHLAPECSDTPFDFVLDGQPMELLVPGSPQRNAGELMPDHLLVRTKVPVWKKTAAQIHSTLIRWKWSFRGWCQILMYEDTHTLIIKPDNSLFFQTRLPNNSFSRKDGTVTVFAPKAYAPKQWHMWPKEPVSPSKMKKILEWSSSFKEIPVHYELLVRAIKSFNDEYFELAVTYSAMALERAVYELATAIPRSRDAFSEDLDYLLEQGTITRRDRKEYLAKFSKLENGRLTLGELLRFLPALPFNKSVKEMKILTAELLTKVNDPRIAVLHRGKRADRDTAHESVTTTMNVIYNLLEP